MAFQNAEAIQKLYVAYFNRPADYYGLQFWDKAVTDAGTNGSAVLAQISAQFAASDEYKATYAGMDVRNTINTIYKNLFGHSADVPGLDFWTNAVSTGAMTLSNAVEQIAAGAQNADKVAYASKVSAATTFTNSLTTTDQILGYSGDKANIEAKGFLAGVTDANSLATAIDPANLAVTINSVIGVNAPVGDTKALTVGIDSLTGTANNDVFNAFATGVTANGGVGNTLSANDVIDGGAGIDTLNIEVVTSATGGGIDGTGPSSYNASQVGTVRNVEIINIDNTAAAVSVFGNADGKVDAAKFIGATNINQISKAAGVVNLAASTTATFTNVAAGTDGLAVAAAAAATSAKIALSEVSGDADSNVVTVKVSGDALSAVTLTGSITEANDDEEADAASLALDIAAGKNVTKVSVNTAIGATLIVSEKVTAIDASASTGGIIFADNTAVSSITTGSGKDNVTISFDTVAAAGSTAAKNASVSTGAGNDTIVVKTTGTGLTTVDAGAGNDTIAVTKVTGAGLNILGGEGNDTISIDGAPLATTDVIDGGAGTDTISLAGKGARTADDYIVFNKLLKNFETIKFSTAEGGLDAAQLAATYTTIDLASGSNVGNVGTQALVAHGYLNAIATGYSVATSGAITYGSGSLNVTEKSTGTVNAYADNIKLAITAGTAGDITGTLAGNVKSAVVTLTNGLTTDGETDTIAHLSLTNVATAGVAGTPAVGGTTPVAAVPGTIGKDLASLTLTGNGSASVTNADKTALVTIDASGLGGKYTVGDDAGTAISGLTYVSNNSAAETIKLGAGIDTITLNASTYGKIDTVTGLNLTLATGGTELGATSDHLHINGVTDAVKFTSTQTDIDLVLKDAAAYKVDGADADTLVFSFGGDTYVFQDKGTAGSIDAADTIVKLTGAINLDTLIVALKEGIPS